MTARILLIDIETAPSLGFVWGKYDQDVIEFERDWYILSFAYKFLDTDGILVRALPDYKGYKTNPANDYLLLLDLWKLLDEADIVIAHNGAAFDVKKINARFLVHGIKPPSTYKVLDTLKEVKKHFRFDSNRLNDLGKILNLGTKTPTVGFAIWRGCMEGDKAAWEVMKEYNAQDIFLLEKIYLAIRSWINHPDINLFGGGGNRSRVDAACPACGGVHIHRRGIVVARTRRYQRLNCQSCGHWFQGALEEKSK